MRDTILIFPYCSFARCVVIYRICHYMTTGTAGTYLCLFQHQFYSCLAERTSLSGLSTLLSFYASVTNEFSNGRAPKNPTLNIVYKAYCQDRFSDCQKYSVTRGPVKLCYKSQLSYQADLRKKNDTQLLILYESICRILYDRKREKNFILLFLIKNFQPKEKIFFNLFSILKGDCSYKSISHLCFRTYLLESSRTSPLVSQISIFNSF